MFNGLFLVVISAALLIYEFQTGTAVPWSSGIQHKYHYLIQARWFSQKIIENRSNIVIEFNSDQKISPLIPSSSTTERSVSSSTSQPPLTSSTRPPKSTTSATTNSTEADCGSTRKTSEPTKPPVTQTTTEVTLTTSEASTEESITAAYNSADNSQPPSTTATTTESTVTPTEIIDQTSVGSTQTTATETRTVESTSTERYPETTEAIAAEVNEATSDTSTSLAETTTNDSTPTVTISPTSEVTTSVSPGPSTTNAATEISVWTSETIETTTSDSHNSSEALINTTTSTTWNSPALPVEEGTVSKEILIQPSTTTSTVTSSSATITSTINSITRTTWECGNNSYVTIPAAGVQIIQTPDADNQTYGCYVYLTGTQHNVLASLRAFGFGGRTSCNGNYIYIGVHRFCWSELSNALIGLTTYDSEYYLYIRARRLTYRFEVIIQFDDNYAAPFVAQLGPSAVSFLFVGYFDPRVSSNLSSYQNTIRLPSNRTSLLTCQNANLVTQNNANICLVVYTDTESVNICGSNLTSGGPDYRRTLLSGSRALLYLSSNVMPLTFGMAAFQCSLVDDSRSSAASFTSRGHRHQAALSLLAAQLEQAVNNTSSHTLRIDELVPWSFIDTAINSTLSREKDYKSRTLRVSL